jgi:hypothetical protein
VTGALLAWSDLQVGYAQCRDVVEAVRPRSDDDWLIVAGDVAELTADVEWALALLAGRFAKVVWTPGNHELWTHPHDQVTLRGVQRYQHLLGVARFGTASKADGLAHAYETGVVCSDEHLLRPDPYPTRARAVVYGPLHIPRRVSYDGVPFIESSVGYPLEWTFFGGPLGPRQVPPATPEAG